MKNLVLVAVALAALSPIAATQNMYRFAAVESVSINRPGGNVFRDNRIRAYNNPSSTSARDLHGLYRFDLSGIPDTEKITGMKLVLTMENAFGSPRNGPIVNLHYSADDKWTRASATGTSGAVGAVVTANQSTFKFPTHTFDIDLTAHDFQKDLLDDGVTLVIDNVNPLYSYIYFYGHTGSPTGQNAELVVLTGGCTGSGRYATFGKGGQDSTKTVVEIEAAGCPSIGQTARIGVKTGSSTPLPGILYLGASNTSWGPVKLPLDLGFLGASGNSLYISLDLLAGAAAGTKVPVPIPNDQGLIGRPAYLQMIVLDPAANSFGRVFSDGLAMTIGR